MSVTVRYAHHRCRKFEALVRVNVVFPQDIKSTCSFLVKFSLLYRGLVYKIGELTPI